MAQDERTKNRWCFSGLPSPTKNDALETISNLFSVVSNGEILWPCFFTPTMSIN